jgi:pyruvate,water dikinase
MGRLTEWVRRFISGHGTDHSSSLSEEDLRAAFRERYHSFKLLLTANNKALEIMTELQTALKGGQSFGMSFVRSRCLAVCVNVYRMIVHLGELAPNKYGELLPRFEEIRSQLEEIVSYKKLPTGSRLIVPLSQLDGSMVDETGPKMANIGEIRSRLGVNVPSGFVVTSTGFQRFFETNELKAEIDRRIQSAKQEGAEDLFTLSANIRQLIVDTPLPADLESALTEAYHDLETMTKPNVRVSVRSSALGEDVAGRAFAGQFQSELNVSLDHLLYAYKEVVASKYSLPAVSYRFSRGIPDEDVAMSVGCMEMVDATAGGVMYSGDPLNPGDDSIVINSVWGLPKAVVDAAVEPDLFVVLRRPALHIDRRTVSRKDRQFRCDPEEGVCRMELTDSDAVTASLTDDQVLTLAEIAMRIEDHFGCAQDVEWAVDGGGAIVILQCRPLQQNSTVEVPVRRETPSFSAPLLAAGGATASQGIGSGVVCRVAIESDKLRFPSGGVLVTVQALPTWASLLGQASAVVTELGSVTCHLANVAREFGVPAIFGLEAATDKLPENETITVDADTRQIYRGIVDELLATVPAKKNLMEGSAVYRTLTTAIQHVVPLNLLDPDSPEFHPRKCITLHDITRFVHEKSVQEMFSFGKDHPVSPHASKQLMGDVPMQWWVVDLDDGFHAPVKGKFVRMEEIASIPMQALWDGIVAVPWAGPPKMDTGGFMSVLMQATTNPGLDPALHSPYAVRNYFMISKNFCSLSSRFGFHFSTVEALVGDRSRENYVSFVFKGGAADRQRRVTRAALIAAILEEFEFRVQLNDDGVVARIEGRDQDFMESRLVVIGYLIMHTRQLDMVMADHASVLSYRRKLTDQIITILGRPRSPGVGTAGDSEQNTL